MGGEQVPVEQVEASLPFCAKTIDASSTAGIRNRSTQSPRERFIDTF
jgi:hypothetical protein